MGREEVELIPQGLITCILNKKEVRILKISLDDVTVRLLSEENIEDIEICFYDFNKYRYDKLKISDFKVRGIIKEKFYFKYIIDIRCSRFSENVKRIFNNYTKYIMLKNYGEENEFSKVMTGYPKEKDLEFYQYYSSQKKDWMKSIAYEENIEQDFDLAVKIDNYVLYKEFMNRDINSFKEYYYNENFIHNKGIFKKAINRVYIGNEFCHNLFPEKDLLIMMIEKSIAANLDITICFTYLRECYIEKNKDIIEEVYYLCKEKNKKIEIVINDWGMLSFLENKNNYFTVVLGVLLNKRKKDPRYLYKKGYEENKELIGENSLNSKAFGEFLKEHGIERYEYEACGYELKIAQGKSSIQLPFYVTNTSQYCPLNAVCENGERGKQKLVRGCKKYCMDYVFLYPKHLKMVGKYNSLFSFDETILKDSDKLNNYLASGIDRVVLNFI